MTSFASKIIDLTHTLASDIPTWDGDCGFHLALQTDYKDCAGPDLFRLQKITTRAGMGTHIDAPAHCFPGTKTTDAIKLESLITDCVVIKVNDRADENYVLMPEVIQKFEGDYGRIKPNSFVIIYTGWDRRWANPSKYRNDLKFPSLHESTGALLLERDIAGLGTDTLSPDAGDKTFPIHRIVLGAGKYLVENIANAKDLRPTGARVLIMPMKIKGATEAPIRLAAVID